MLSIITYNQTDRERESFMTPSIVNLEEIKANILVVDDHQPVRQSILDWLNINFPKCVFFQSASGEESVRMAAEIKPALILMDIELNGGMNGLEATKRIKKGRPEATILILTIHEGTQYQKESAKAGADGFLSKSEMYSKLVPLMTALLSQKPIGRHGG
jgi:DNA-binding NarL/FixJ family response regulator